jgi:hypothetical protein
MDPYLALLLIFLACVVAFSTFIGGFYLWAACLIFDQVVQSAERSRAIPGSTEPARELKTTDAGPYTAPGTLEPSEPAAKEGPPNLSVAPSYLMAIVISFCVCVVAALANWLLGALLLGPGNPQIYNAYYPWIAPPLTFAIAMWLHTAMLQTTILRGFLITLMLIGPWGATALAVGIICYRPPPTPPTINPPAPAVTSHVN